MNKVKIWIRRYFGFSQRETNGFMVLLLITIIAIILPFLFYNNPPAYNPQKDQAELDSLVAELEARNPSDGQKRNYSTYKRNYPVATKALYLFDPNKLTQEEWQEIGVSKYAAINLIKYREKAGGFKYKEQIERIYGIPTDLYQKLEPFINLPSRNAEHSNKNTFAGKSAPNYPARTYPEYKKNISRLQPFDINAADTMQLKRIRGIGSKLSARIVKFRDKLGGFYSGNQLKEVYGLTPEVLDSLDKYTFVEPGFAPPKININTATLEELRAHPYIGFNIARLIVSYRTQHGSYQNLDQLQNIKLLDVQKIQKLKPYLTL